MSRVRQLFAALAVVLIALPAGARVRVGTPEPFTGNCIPVGCNIGWNRFQEAYSASNFAGRVDISSFSFLHTVFQP